MSPPITASNSIRVTDDTTIEDLNRLLGSATGDGTKLRGKVNADKSVTLYLSDKSSSQWQRMTGAAHKKNDAAKLAVGQIYSNFDKLAVKHGWSSESNQSLGKRILSNITATLDTFPHALRAGPLGDLAANTKAVGESLGLHKAKVLPAALQALLGPDVTLDLHPEDVNSSVESVLKAKGGALEQKAVNAIFQTIQKALEERPLPADTWKALIHSSGESVRNQVENEISERIRMSGGEPPAHLQDLVKQAFERVASTALGTRQVGPRTPAILDGEQTNIQLPTIEIRGERYTATKQLGAGGYGAVYLYASVNDPGKTVAFKVILPEKLQTAEDSEKARGGFIHEVMAHQRATQGGASNLTGIEGAVRLDDGTLGIAFEVAPNGSAFDMAMSLKGLTGAGPGQITSRQADLIRLAIFKGVLQGLRSIDQRDMIHFDFKSANCMIGSDGQAKIIDFGESASTRTVGLQDLPEGVQNVRYLPPEVSSFILDMENVKKAEKKDYKQDLSSKLVKLLGLPEVKRGVNPGATPHGNYVDKIFTNHGIPTLVAKEAARRPPVDHKLDVWGAGVALFELFAGKIWQDDGGGNLDIQNDLIAWASDPLKKPAIGELAPSTGNDGVDDLLNKMLAADPADRIDVNRALAHRLFQTPDIDDPALSQFLPKLAQHGLASKKYKDKIDEFATDRRVVVDFMLTNPGGVLTDAQKARLKADDCTTAEWKAILGGMLPADQARVREMVDKITAAETALPALKARRDITAAEVDTAKASIAKLA